MIHLLQTIMYIPIISSYLAIYTCHNFNGILDNIN